MITPLLLALAPFAQEPELLPPGPAGWSFERLDLPLSFAPDLEFEGFEELWFAPGMFTEGADSYWSYVLALRIEEELEVDEAFLRHFFEAYYLGLTKAVGESRNLAIDPDAFSIEVSRHGAGYLMELELVDAFVTGKELHLRVEVESHHAPGRTELFGAASPHPREAPIWKELDDQRASWRSARPVPAFLNHLYVVPDAETYRALRDSEFLREAFAISEVRSTERTDTSYTGTYFYGVHTYFEFLDPERFEELAVGSTGLAIGFEQPGGTARVLTELEKAGYEVFRAPVTRVFEGAQVPWFEMIGVTQPTPGFSLFSLEYDERFLDRWSPHVPPLDRGIARDLILSRYAHHLERRLDGGLFVDVDRVHLALNEEERTWLLGACDALGYERTQKGAEWTCRGPGYELVLHESPDSGGIQAFEMRLRWAVEREVLRFGSAELTLDGERAVFRFGG